MKRKGDDQIEANGASGKRRATGESQVKDDFRQGLFEEAVLDGYTDSYAESAPYKHGVIRDLMNDSLLRAVRSEVLDQINFTPKETDIYKIHQSGDLANLDGLDDKLLSRLPSLLKLRDALYSKTFREWIAHVGNSGPLSGKKTDMAINVYTPGCHLLCHDDVIGSRRLSYILYLTDPDKPWQAEWGGALRLYPTTTMKGEDGTEVVVPSAEFSKSIPPSWNQLSFFTIQPGLSFHDVEEVYARKAGQGDDSTDGGRLRMAISGWFHIPQEGEDGYEEGLEEKLAEKSSLTQLQQSKADQFDLPETRWRPIEKPEEDPDNDLDWTEDELGFLVQYINPGYLVPDALEELSETFRENSVATLTDFLHPKFAARLKEYITSLDTAESSLPQALGGASNDRDIARPPHKHRFLFRHATTSPPSDTKAASPLDLLLDTLFPSPLFTRWLHLFTGLDLQQCDILARRFRRGHDYTLASGYDEDSPQLELALGLTPTEGWGGDGLGADDSDEEDGIPADAPPPAESKDEETVGGYEVYMVGEDDDEPEGGEGGAEASYTGTGHRGKSHKADPAVYRASEGEEDDGVLFSMPASWNSLSVVLRDRGLLRFVKYVSASAPGDRFDVVSAYAVNDDDDEGDED
ncbi:hypothetical protein BT63DRAFT_430897 [Microthyrium microscopicum]|uniref:uS12 prolyl 3,4-dihydroxylase n=1 Tax=Microthyrium microscopicum TaxID=703497 RepID=A0A6A6USS8_9PEZI|nr:hypothetical protein BT63DRAFT_430897 [Microthyrium microscopicum]